MDKTPYTVTIKAISGKEKVRLEFKNETNLFIKEIDIGHPSFITSQDTYDSIRQNIDAIANRLREHLDKMEEQIALASQQPFTVTIYDEPVEIKLAFKIKPFPKITWAYTSKKHSGENSCDFLHTFDGFLGFLDENGLSTGGKKEITRFVEETITYKKYDETKPVKAILEYLTTLPTHKETMAHQFLMAMSPLKVG